MVLHTGKQQQVELSHGTTHYLEAGTGEPVILLHGVGFWTGGDYWLQNIDGIGSTYHVYAPDFVGWGDGDRLGVEYSFAYLVDFVREFMDVLGIPSAHIIGHSMGGWVAALLAYESPDRVRTLTLAASGGMSTRTLSAMTAFQPPTYEQLLEHAMETIGDAKTGVESSSKALEEITSSTVDVKEIVDRWYRRTQLPEALHSYQLILNHMNHPVHRARYNLQRRLGKLRMPTLLVWGEHDEVNPVEMGEQMHASISTSQFVTLPSGHYVPSEAPEEFNETVVRFLHEHRSAGDIL